MKPNAIWSTGAKVPKWLLSYKMYVRQILKNGMIAVSTLQTGAISGMIKPEYLDFYLAPTPSSTTPVKKNFKSYLIIVTANALNVRNGAGMNYKTNITIKKGQVFTIVDEKDGWGKLKSGAGWINLSYTKKL